MEPTCKDLAVGFSELDKQKYELHIKTTTKAIEIAKQRGREDIAEKNEKKMKNNRKDHTDWVISTQNKCISISRKPESFTSHVFHDSI